MLDVESVKKTFFAHTATEKIALNNLSIHLDEGDFVTMIGSNGAGKSTLLNVISGRYRPDSGAIRIAGHDVTKLPDWRIARYLGRVFQDPMAGTAPHLTIEENLSLALARGTRRGLGRGIGKAKRDRFKDELAVLQQGLENRLTTKVGLLSGGQRQALSLVMATFQRPKVLLLDEHTAALDPERAELITRLTEELVAAQQLTTLMVTHNMEQALRLGNRLIMMHEGRIVLELAGEQKAQASVTDLLGAFGKMHGAVISDEDFLN